MMDNLTTARAEKIIASLYSPGTKVDSHRFERDAIRLFRASFALDFLEYIGNADPLKAFSQDFGRWIKGDWTVKRLVSATGNKPITANLRGTDSANEEWIVL